MVQLTADECRVLGVLVEKAMTVPSQYPMTLNSLVIGSNQKNNREPVTNLDENRVMRAVDGLRSKNLVVQVDMAGSRVLKWRHTARETLQVQTAGLVILTELMLRGPQTAGELRTRASRMHPLESLGVVQNVLESLMNRPEPLVQRLPPAPGDRAERYAQLLKPDLHPLDAPALPRSTAEAVTPGHDPALVERIEELELQVTQLRHAMQKLASSLGEPDPFGHSV